MPLDITEKDIALLILGAVIGFALSALAQFAGDVGRFAGFGGIGRIEDEAKDYEVADTATKALIMQEYFFASFRYLIVANMFWVLSPVGMENIWIGGAITALTFLAFSLSLGRILRFQRVRANARRPEKRKSSSGDTPQTG